MSRGRCSVGAGAQSGPVLSRRKAQWEQEWKRKECAGRGAYGSVWLEECVSGQRDVTLRAVKQMQKPNQDATQGFYFRELQAIMKFSNPRVCQFLLRNIY